MGRAQEHGLKARWWWVAPLIAALSVGGYFGYKALSGWMTASMIAGIKSRPGFDKGPAAVSSPAEQGISLGGAKGSSSDIGAAAQTSSLDLIQRLPVGQAAPSQAQVQTLQKAGLGMIDSVRPLLNDPRFTKNLSPDQTEQYRQLLSMLDEAESAAKGPAAGC